MKEYNIKRNLFMAVLIAGAEACTPKSVIDQTSELNPVEPKLLQEAIECVLKAETGKTVLEINDSSDQQREVLVAADENYYGMDVTKTYPKPYYENVPYFNTTGIVSERLLPYVIVGGGSGRNKEAYFDGKSLKPDHFQDKLDGIVDYAIDTNTEMENEQITGLIGNDIDPVLLHGVQQYQFETKRDIWQKSYDKAIKQIAQACNKNK